MTDLIQKDLINLLRITVRLFYPPPTAIIYDLLILNTPISQIEIITLLRISYREFNKHIFPLKNDKLISSESQIHETRTILYFYINPLECYNIIKYKLYKMNKNCESKTNCFEENYKCSICENEYTSLETQSLIKDFKFICCDKELELIIDKFDYGVYQKFMVDCGPIIKMLKELEGLTIESIDFLKAKQIKIEKELKNSKEELNFSTKEIIKKEEEINLEKKIIENENIEEMSDFSNENEKIEEIEKEEKEIIISINGLRKNILFVTDDDLEQMTESEYENYFSLKESIE